MRTGNRLAMHDQNDLLALLKKLDHPGQGSAPGHPSGNCQRGLTSIHLDRFQPGAGRLRETSGSQCWLIRSQADLTGSPSPEGYRCPVEVPGGTPHTQGLAEMTGDSRWNDLDLKSVAFIDTETSGLSTGPGTVAFLIGIGRFEKGGFTVDQFFIDDFDGLPAMVSAVNRTLKYIQALVSYNGQSFDLPLLESQWRMQRQDPPFGRFLHLDLLHPARRLWKLRLPDCSLSTVEQSILNIRRNNDIPGSRVPGIYFDYQNNIQPERILSVLHHNAQDVYSLGGILSVIHRAWSSPDDPIFSHASDQWGLARMLISRNRIQEGLARLEAAARIVDDEDLDFRLSIQLARHYKRSGRWDDAIRIWKSQLSHASVNRLESYVELAKQAEHHERNFRAARNFTEQALVHIDQESSLKEWGPGEQLDPPQKIRRTQVELFKRRDRLNRKLQRGEKGVRTGATCLDASRGVEGILTRTRK
jgi:uncharacterized protein YprB with RNaseH-like and TPR domain